MRPFDHLDALPARRFGRQPIAELHRVRPAELHDAWMFAEADASLALAAWRAAPRADKPRAHAAYVAALEREAHAAQLLEQRLRP